MDKQNIDYDSLSIIYGISFKCPADERCESCPFLPMDYMTFKEKVKWIEKLSEYEKEQILKHHINCSGNRSYSR